MPSVSVVMTASPMLPSVTRSHSAWLARASSARRREVTSRKLHTRPTFSSPEELGSREAFEDAAVGELQEVVGVLRRGGVDLLHAIDEGRGSANATLVTSRMRW